MSADLEAITSSDSNPKVKILKNINHIRAPLIITPNSREPLKSAQMLGASKRATFASIEVREDCEFVGNDADGCFLEVPINH